MSNIFSPAFAEPVPYDEVAGVLACAALRLPGGPPALVLSSGERLAAALQAAGFWVVRESVAGRLLTV